MNNLRIKFLRGEEVKYISHLDLMKVFERAIRRAGIPIVYSQGFNPHPQMVFGLPLSVGVTSEAEYADFELAERMEPAEFIQKMNNNLPNGFKVVDARHKQTKANIMASITMASYEVLVSSNENVKIDFLNVKIEEFLKLPLITVKKEGKNGIRDVDIKPMIHKLEAKILEGSGAIEPRKPEDYYDKSIYCSNVWLTKYVNELEDSGIKFSYKLENIFCLLMLVSAGSAANLKPELLMSALSKITCLNFKTVKIHRIGLFTGKAGDLSEPLDDRVLLG